MPTNPTRNARLLRPLESPKPELPGEASTAAGHGQYPLVRMRRNRSDAWTRRLVAENRLAIDDLIWPVFVHEADGRADVPSMPGIQRLSIAALIDEDGAAAELGIPALALFPV